MFRTYESDMAGVPGMFGKGLAHWHTVSRVLRMHWYYVTVQHELEGRQVEYELMINDEHQLEAVLNSKDPTMVVIGAQVVIPAYMNGGGIPSMEPLTRVSVGEDELECVVCIIEVEGGAVYHDSHRKDFNRALVSNLREIFHSSRIRPV
ncbi:hypothetical protein [Pseudomonas violetae]|uniref:Uncharacterized protein n=1 Tax=Pseudomonas violetae TaxID=2915813 RepID=A0ABT0F185_9PSED|nr:hypothetical protein [Pseudomonas violetae]MCK1791760.1 hypothetical protein [Pseudomonas violetae]